ncbi:hypothetical protein [Leptospira wolffii]|uniref:hypothetical protein n=1 Tax=Leptospira wolffii TaxID=409998 RepID=UPI00031FDC76|nr:hypothetical protein [Leptospira wolffii]EPG66088.1 hypothetical protein LEP1GSC061_2367 [Leptospira wolffii serovar Khorat str. Khorat-H2]
MSKRKYFPFLILSLFFLSGPILSEEAVIVMQNVDLPGLGGDSKKKVPLDELEIVEILNKKKDAQGNELFEIRTGRCEGERCVSGWVGKYDFIPLSQFKKVSDMNPFEFSSCIGESCINYSFGKNGELNYYYVMSFSEASRHLLPLAKCADGDEEKIVDLEKFCSGSGSVYQAGNFLRLLKKDGNLLEYLKYIPDQLVTNRYDSIDYFEALLK